MARNSFIITALLLGWFGVVCQSGYAQKMPERGLVRKGNRQFDRGNFERSIERYNQALQHDSLSFEAIYDLGNAMFRAERFEGAEQALARAAADTTRSDTERAEAFFNLGDVQFRQQNLQGALESFKNSLRLNPSDMEAKYNYAFTKKLLEEQEQDQNNDNNQNEPNDQNNQQNQDKDNQQNNQNDQNNDNQNKPDDNSDKDDQNGDRDRQNDPQNGNDGQQKQQGSISQEQAEAMLEAIQAQEDKTQDKVKEKQGVIIRGNKNW